MPALKGKGETGEVAIEIKKSPNFDVFWKTYKRQLVTLKEKVKEIQGIEITDAFLMDLGKLAYDGSDDDDDALNKIRAILEILTRKGLKEYLSQFKPGVETKLKE
jgi:hypothetical protein